MDSLISEVMALRLWLLEQSRNFFFRKNVLDGFKNILGSEVTMFALLAAVAKSTTVKDTKDASGGVAFGGVSISNDPNLAKKSWVPQSGGLYVKGEEVQSGLESTFLISLSCT
jgi:hypothetical protein